MSRAAVALLTLACAATVSGLRPRLFAALDATVAIEDVYYLPADNRVTRLLTLGYTEAGADLLWMKALLYYTENLGSRGEAGYAMNYAEALVALDPDFAEAYHWAGMLPFYLSVESTPEVRRRGTNFLIRGAERLPDNGKLQWDAAATILYELLPTFTGSEAEREALQRRALELGSRALALRAAPAWFAFNTTTLLTRLGEDERAIRFLEQELAATQDPSARAELLLRLQSLRAGAESAIEESTRLRFEADRAAQFPYLTEDEFVLVGPRRFP